MGGADFQRRGSERVREPDLRALAPDGWAHNHPNGLVFEHGSRWKSWERQWLMHGSAPGAYPMSADSRGFSVSPYSKKNDDDNQDSSASRFRHAFFQYVRHSFFHTNDLHEWSVLACITSGQGGHQKT